MSTPTDLIFDDADFIYSPEQPLTIDQRVEVLEGQVADLRAQLSSMAERLCNDPWSAGAGNAWD